MQWWLKMELCIPAFNSRKNMINLSLVQYSFGMADRLYTKTFIACVTRTCKCRGYVYKWVFWCWSNNITIM